MTNIAEDRAAESEKSPFDPRVLRALFDIAKQYKKQFIVVTFFSFLYTGLDLLQPLVYRQAINAVAGMFVNQVPAAAPGLGNLRRRRRNKRCVRCWSRWFFYFLSR